MVKCRYIYLYIQVLLILIDICIYKYTGMSANSDDETRKEALKAGMDHFIAKPFKVDRFCDIMNSV
jgi:response regulator of citrate/malate metabolism